MYRCRCGGQVRLSAGYGLKETNSQYVIGTYQDLNISAVRSKCNVLNLFRRYTTRESLYYPTIHPGEIVRLSVIYGTLVSACT